MKYRDAMLAAGQAYFYRLLSESSGDMAKAAQLAGLHRTTMYKILQKYGLKVEHRPYVKQDQPGRKYPIK